jgi:RNA polymerase subunit RPABC4/transcription elongation factor Spt4
MWTHMIEFLILFIFMGICICIAAMARLGRVDSEDRRTVSIRTPRSSSRPRSSRIVNRYIRSQTRTKDRSSSPIGGTCLDCGAVFEEETSLQCPNCGVDRQRCPICQRFVTANQDLLACPHCGSIGHANEMELWVHEERVCPHCGRKLATFDLQEPEKRPKKRSRKRRSKRTKKSTKKSTKKRTKKK